MSKGQKLIIWHVCLLILAVGFWRYVDYVVNVITPESWNFDVEPAGILNLLVLLAFSSLGLMFFHERKWTLSQAGAIAVPFIVISGLSWINLIGMGIILLLFMDASRAIKEDLKERLKFNARTVLRRGMAQIVISIFLLISFAAYQSPVAKALAEMDKLPSVAAPFIQTVTEKIVYSQIPGDVTAQQKDVVVGQLSGEAYQQANDFFVLYRSYIPPALAFTLFLVLWGLSWLFVWIGVSFGMLFYVFLKNSNFIKIEEYETKAERIIV